jgi:hypothetical protein
MNVTSDYEERVGGLEPEWANGADPNNLRLRGPASYLADGDETTAWRADRGPGRRNTDSVAVAQFEQPVTLPPGTQLKVALVQEHGSDDNGPRNAQIGRFRVSLTQAKSPTARQTPYTAVLAMQTPPTKRTGAQQQVIFDAWRLAQGDKFKAFQVAMDKHWRSYPEAETSVLHLAERRQEDARETRLLDRGVWNQGKEPVKPHVLAALHPLAESNEPQRLRYARWLVDKRSPLTARVAVNRVWQTLFGTGIVETTEDFGTRAPEPSHQDLLDWLAVDFMEHGWSQKHLLRNLLSSATYRQSSKASPALLERDPKNRLLARGPRFRVEAEVVRDVALATSGLLAEKSGGPSVYPPVPASVLEYQYKSPSYWTPPTDTTRYVRSLYLFRKRSMPDPVMSAFDAPTGDTSCTRRPRSNSPLAALTSLNEPIFVEAAQALALRVLREGGANDAARVSYAFRLCTSRAATTGERDALLDLLQSRKQRLHEGKLKATEIAFSPMTHPADLPPNATPNDIAAWAIVGRVLLNLDETLSKN